MRGPRTQGGPTPRSPPLRASGPASMPGGETSLAQLLQAAQQAQEGATWSPGAAAAPAAPTSLGGYRPGLQAPRPQWEIVADADAVGAPGTAIDPAGSGLAGAGEGCAPYQSPKRPPMLLAMQQGYGPYQDTGRQESGMSSGAVAMGTGALLPSLSLAAAASGPEAAGLGMASGLSQHPLGARLLLPFLGERAGQGAMGSSARGCRTPLWASQGS